MGCTHATGPFVYAKLVNGTYGFSTSVQAHANGDYGSGSDDDDELVG